MKDDASINGWSSCGFIVILLKYDEMDFFMISYSMSKIEMRVTSSCMDGQRDSRIMREGGTWQWFFCLTRCTLIWSEIWYLTSIHFAWLTGWLIIYRNNFWIEAQLNEFTSLSYKRRTLQSSVDIIQWLKKCDSGIQHQNDEPKC